MVDDVLDKEEGKNEGHHMWIIAPALAATGSKVEEMWQ
jgi:uncharacterized protein (DUF1810 family)